MSRPHAAEPAALRMPLPPLCAHRPAALAPIAVLLLTALGCARGGDSGTGAYDVLVRVQRSGVRRTVRCDTCGWRKGARFLARPKAVEHLAEAHQATVDPAAAS